MRRAYYHKTENNYRVCFRQAHGYTVQQWEGTKGTRDHDPWYDISLPSETQEAAISIMYSRFPLPKGVTP